MQEEKSIKHIFHSHLLTRSEIHKHANNLSIENAKSCLHLNYVDALLYQDQIEDSLLAISKSEKLNFISLKIPY